LQPFKNISLSAAFNIISIHASSSLTMHPISSLDRFLLSLIRKIVSRSKANPILLNTMALPNGKTELLMNALALFYTTHISLYPSTPWQLNTLVICRIYGRTTPSKVESPQPFGLNSQFLSHHSALSGVMPTAISYPKNNNSQEHNWEST